MLPRKDNLIVYLPLNGAKDPTGKALDLSGRGNHGTISGTEAYVTNQFSKQSQSFDGINTANNITIPVSNSILSITSQITVFGFIKAISAEGTYSAIIRSPSGYNSFGLDYDPVVNTLRFYIYDSGINRLVSTQSVDCKKAFVFVVGTYDGIRLKLYADGVLKNTTEYTGDIDAPTGGLLFPNSSTPIKFNGYIYNNGVYNTALTDTEVKQLYSHLSNPPNYIPKLISGLSSDGVDDYVNTNFTISGNYKLEIIGKFNSFSGADRIGSLSSGPLYFGADSVNFLFLIGSNTTPVNHSTRDLNIHNFTFEPTGFSIDGVKNTTIFSYTPCTNFVLYRRGVGECSKFTTYEVRYWENGVLLKHLLPDPNRVGNFVDRLSGTIYSNSGTGSLSPINSYYNVEDSSMVLHLRSRGIDLAGKTTPVNVGTITGSGVMKFTGVSQITCGTSSRYDFLSNNQSFTIAMVVNSDALDSTSRRWITKRDSTGLDGYLISFGRVDNNPNVIHFQCTKGGIRYGASYIGTQPPIGRNLHIVATWNNSTNTPKLYINGILYTGNVGAFGESNNTNLSIGGTDGSGTAKGLIYSCKLYTEEKNLSWIRNEYRNELRYW